MVARPIATLRGTVSVCVAACLVVSGCGGEDVYPVTGTVTLDGAPLPDASVTFLPESEAEDALPAFGWTDDQGNYSLLQGMRTESAVAPGTYRVRITTYRAGKPLADPPIPTVPEKVPAKYNDQSELVKEVKAEDNVFDFPLDSQGEIIQPEPPEPL